MKKHATPEPTSRAAALSQSANQYAAGAASAWQNIAGNSARLAAANRRANEPGRAPLAPGQATPPDNTQHRLIAPAYPTLAPGQRPEPEETIRQVGWREVERAVGMSTKRKYNFLGIGFGPKVPAFETEKVTVPVYQETNRSRLYYAVTKAVDTARIQREGLKPAASFGDKHTTPRTIEQANSQGHLRFFSSEAAAYRYAQATTATDYVILSFKMPEYHDFTLEISSDSPKADSSARVLRTAHTIAPEFVRKVRWSGGGVSPVSTPSNQYFTAR